MKNTLRPATLLLALVVGLAPTFAAQAQSTPWLVRLRAVNLESANGGSTTPNLDLSVNNKVIPELDISYFFTPEIAAELVLTIPQKHSLRSAGTEIGTLKHLPPTLTAQYHLTSLGQFKPYVGAGLNYTHFSNVSFVPAVAALQPSISKNSVGLALQVGADYAITPTTWLNVDIKKVQIKTDVKSAGTKIGELKVDPLLVGLGVGWRF